MKKVHRTIAVAIILCLTFAGTGVLEAVHLSQCVYHSRDIGHHGQQPDKSSNHDPAKCSVCLHFAFNKTTPASAAKQINSTLYEAEKVSLPESAVLASIYLTSISSRAPPIL